jgi:pyridoxamine 5'-phosphate oxidase
MWMSFLTKRVRECIILRASTGRCQGESRVEVRDLSVRSEQRLRKIIWEQLQWAVTHHDHAWRTPVLASVDGDGIPQARTVVLRDADATAQHLVVYTDHRSPKVAAFALRPQAMLVFWSKALHWQLRVAADIRVETEGRLVEDAWHRIHQTVAAADYLSLQAPGSPAQAYCGERAEHHALGIIIASVRSIDWLELRAEGHRRALLTHDEFNWLAP